MIYRGSAETSSEPASGLPFKEINMLKDVIEKMPKIEQQLEGLIR